MTKVILTVINLLKSEFFSRKEGFLLQPRSILYINSIESWGCNLFASTNYHIIMARMLPYKQ